jgi:hypothetical protein
MKELFGETFASKNTGNTIKEEVVASYKAAFRWIGICFAFSF